MEQTGIVAEEHKMRRTNTDLRHIVDFQTAALVRGRLHTSLGVCQHVIQHTGGNTGGCLIADIVDQLKKAIHTLAGLCRDKQNGRIGHISQITAHFFSHAVHGLTVFFDQIPLVDDNNAGLACFMGHTGHLSILLGDTFGGVDHDEAHIGTLNGHGSTEHAVLLNIFFHLGLLTDAGGINEHKLALVVFKTGVNGVACGACHIGDDHTLLTKDLIDQRRLARVRLANDGHLNGVILFFLFFLLREVLDTGIQQIAGSVTMNSRNSNGIAQSQIVELIKIRVHSAGLIHLVNCQHNGLAATQQHVGNLLIRSGQAGLNICKKDNHSGRVNRDLCLITHKSQNLVIGTGLNAAGINQSKLAATPLTFAVNTVAGDARGIFHDGKPSANQLIEQHGLAHIRTAHDGNNGFHRLSLPFISIV